MPVLNASNGKSLMGVTSLLSVDGVVPAALVGTEARLGAWLDAADHVAIYQQDSLQPAPFLDTIDLDTSAIVTVSTEGATQLSAGGDVWAAFSGTGVRTSVAAFGPFSNAGVVQVSTDGRVAIVNNINTGGLTVYSAAGVRLYAAPGPVDSGTHRFRGDLLSWAASTGGWQIVDVSTGEPIPWLRQVATVTALVPVVTDDRTWLLESVTVGADQVLTLRGAGSDRLYRIYTGPAFNIDVVELSDGVLRASWSTTAAEALTDLRVADVTVGSGAFELGTTAAGALAFTTQDELSSRPVTVSPYTQGVGMAALFLDKHRFTDGQGTLTEEFGWPWVTRVNEALRSPINLANNVTGVLPPSGGGTGAPGGVTNIDATWITSGTLAQARKWSEATITSVGTQNDVFYNDADFLRANNASALTLTGLVAGVPGQRLVVVAVNDDVTLVHQSGSSSAANRILTFSGLNVTLTTHTAALLEYDGATARWRLLFVSGASADVESVGYWSPLTNDPSINLSEQVQAVGYWTPLMTGPDAATSELVLDINGDCVGVWTQTKDGPIFPQLVDDEGDTIAVFTPTP